MGSDHDAVARWFDGQASSYDGWDRGPFAGLREAELAAVMRTLGDIRGADVLELGCGTGRFTRRMLTDGASRVTVVDVAAEMLARLPSLRVVPVHADAATVRLGRRFRHLLSAGMLEFVPDAAAVLRNAAEHAEDDATLVLLVPRRGVAGVLYRLWHRRHGLGIRLFDDRDLRALAADTGWSVEHIAPVLPFGLVARLSR